MYRLSHSIKSITSAAGILLTLSVIPAGCQRESPVDYADGTVTIGFAAGTATKTASTEDGLSSVWVDGDKIALWAIDSNGIPVLNAQPFSTYSISGTASFFTSVLQSPMPEQQYTYFASYPVPDDVSDGMLRFTVPARQDGKCGKGTEIMFSNTTVSGALKPIIWEEGYDHSELQLSMTPLLHRMRFYMMENADLNGEPIEELQVTFPRSIAGEVRTSLSNPGVSVTGSGDSTVTVLMDTPVPYSTSSERHYINVSIAPASFTADESMEVTIHTHSKVASTTIPLNARTFEAGHSTPVRIMPDEMKDYHRLYFNLTSNPVGEDLKSITLTAPEGCIWPDTGTNVLIYCPDKDIKQGDSFHTEFHDSGQFESFGGKDIQVTFDSEHLRLNRTVHIGSLTGTVSENINMDVPWLLFENFDNVEGFSSHDEYAVSSPGSYSPHTFLNGWSGARAGAGAGKCVRIACRRETSVRYDARMDSAPLNAIIKKPVNLSVEFDYGADNKFGGIPIITDGNVGQTCHIGYITTTENYDSGDRDGTYEHSFYIKEYSGSYDNTPDNDSYIIHNVPAGDIHRISWRTVIENQAGTTNTTAWLYIDNVKVKISEE